MSAAPVSPSDAQEAVAVLDAVLAALPPSKGSRERRMREALREAQRALTKSGSEDRAERAIRRYYARQQ